MSPYNGYGRPRVPTTANERCRKCDCEVWGTSKMPVVSGPDTYCNECWETLTWADLAPRCDCGAVKAHTPFHAYWCSSKGGTSWKRSTT